MQKQSAKKRSSKASVHKTITKKSSSSSKKTTKPPQSLGWSHLQWQQWMDAALFTFSSKIVNSNAEEVGVRIGCDGSAKNLPYLSAQGCQPDLDYVQQQYNSNSGKGVTNSSVFAELSQHLGKKELDNHVPEIDPTVADIHKQIKSIRKELNTSFVPSRVRQILLPHPNMSTGYISASPLACSGMGEKLNQASKSYIERLQTLDANFKGHRSTRMHLRFGGTNPQNIGGLTRQLWRGIVLDNLPTQSQLTQRSFSLKHKGLQLSLPKTMVLNYFSWLSIQKKWTLNIKNEEKKILVDIVVSLKRWVSKQRAILQQIDPPILEQWNIESWKDISFNSVDQGWLLENNHSPIWRREAAEDIVRKMKQVVVERRSDGQNVFMNLSPHESRIVNHLQEVLL